MNRPLLRIEKGASITNNDREYVIIEIADINVVLAKDTETGEKVLLKIGDVGPPKIVQKPDMELPASRSLLNVTEEDWLIAEYRKKLIEPLLDDYYRHADAVANKIAKEADVSRATVYRWVAAFRHTGMLSSLLPNPPSLRGGKGQSRLPAEVETIIKDTFENFHDTDQKTSIAATIEEIRRRCFNAKLKLPAGNTIRLRLEKTNGRDRTLQRHGEAKAHDHHDQIKGKIPDAAWPLAMVQIDHTPLPVIIVDDVYRKSIKRVWLTLAIDVDTRVCLGMHLSLDAPSAMSAGMCISHAILGKERWLAQLGITDVEWPFWGTMGILHMDNAREFRGEMLKFACKEYDIDLHLRPVKKPRYGAHIERMMGTVSEELKSLKGATFSGPTEKGTYDAEGNACVTFSELERWLILFFARYHRRKHHGINTYPLTKWQSGLMGTSKKPGRGIPARRLDEELLRIHFMPFTIRSIHNYGVLIDNVHYYHDVLRPYIGEQNPESKKKLKRTFRFHRDPRDISQLYFYDEIAERYFAIPYRDTSLPPASIWELKEAQKQAEKLGIPVGNEKEVFRLLTLQRELEADSAEKTKVARREQQRRKQHEIARKQKKDDLPTVSTPTASMPAPSLPGYNPDEIRPLDDD